MAKRRKIQALSGEQPHPSRGSWEQYLRDSCELRDQARGVKFYGSVNCNYIVWPCGTLIQNFGYHGRALMDQVRRYGAKAVLRRLLALKQRWDSLLLELRQRDV